MSRTKTGSKDAGYDYWGRRILSGSCGYGPYIKKVTHRRERRIANRTLLSDAPPASAAF